jgi:hypothetical protein
MDVIRSLNIGIRFLWEILALIGFGYWGFHAVDQTFLKIILGIGAPLLAAVLWGAFGSPKAPYALSGFPRLLLEILVFGGAAVALFFAGKQTAAGIYGIIALFNLILMHVWKQ